MKSIGLFRTRSWLPAWLFLAAASCSSQPESPTLSNAVPSNSGLKLHLAVVDDAAMAAAIRRRRGEWAARTGSDLEVSEMNSSDLTAGQAPTADALIFPSRLLGGLAEKKWIIPVRTGILKREKYDANDIFPLIRRHETVWGQQAMALPLGSPVLTLFYRTDLFEKLNLLPPSTWSEYHRIVERFRDRDRLGEDAPPAKSSWFATVEPLAPPWAANVLLARSAGYAKHRSRYSTLFDVETMDPLIAGPPFVQALGEMQAALSGSEIPSLDPMGSRQMILEGRAAMALSWPTASAPMKLDGTQFPVGVSELPGSRKVYNSDIGTWKPRTKQDDGRVPVLGLAGRLGSVTRASRNAPAAFRLLLWLSETEMSSQIGRVSPATTFFRHSQARRPAIWVDDSIAPAAARHYADQLTHTLGRTMWMSGLRIPGADRYIAVLDDAVQRVLSGEQSPKMSLQTAAEKWRQITANMGVVNQKQAYARSLGLEREPSLQSRLNRLDSFTRAP